MKKFFCVIICTLLTLGVQAQSPSCILKMIPDNLDIRDKIIILNSSPITIDRVVVLSLDNPTTSKIGRCESLHSGEKTCIANFEDNQLRNLKGQVIAIKIKGHHKVNGKDIDTYDFDVFFSENSHDLYMKVFFKGIEENSELDF